VGLTEEQVRALVRAERAAIVAEEQANCSHAAFGTLHADLVTITCQNCNKVITRDDWGLGTPVTRVTQEAIDSANSGV
jgi:hypothetical protein